MAGHTPHRTQSGDHGSITSFPTSGQSEWNQYQTRASIGVGYTDRETDESPAPWRVAWHAFGRRLVRITPYTRWRKQHEKRIHNSDSSLRPASNRCSHSGHTQRTGTRTGGAANPTEGAANPTEGAANPTGCAANPTEG